MEGENNVDGEQGIGIEPGVVKETIREILLEIPGFRMLVEKGIPASTITGTSDAGSGWDPITITADSRFLRRALNWVPPLHALTF